MMYELQTKIPRNGQPIIDGLQLSETQDVHVFEGSNFIRTERYEFWRDAVTGALAKVEISNMEDAA